jgi:hypothetical protein
MKNHVEFLINNDAENIHRPLIEGVSPLYFCLLQAVRRKDKKLDCQVEIEIVKYLISNGADLTRKDSKTGLSPMDVIDHFPEFPEFLELSLWLLQNKIHAMQQE